jgi:polyisoprenyl-phosphate glycosyltransferase
MNRRETEIQLSVVVPVYGCADCLSALVERLEAVLAPLVESFEIILVDDRSPDGAWTRITALAEDHPAVRGIRLSRNFGQHAALTAGLEAARGSWVVAMDCDLQDPPEVVPKLLAKAREGYDLVLARRTRRGHSLARRAAAALYFSLLRIFAHADLHGEYGTFSILSREVVDAFLRVNDIGRHYILVLNWLGFARGEIEFVHGERHAGTSSYTLRKLIAHAMQGIFFQTTALLRWIVYAGFGVSTIGAGLAVFVVVNAIVAEPYPGWTSLAVLVLLIGGFTIIALGVAALYIGQIFEQVKARPLYIVDETTADRVPTKTLAS